MKLRPELTSKYVLDYCHGECRDLDGCGDGDVVSNGVGRSVCGICGGSQSKTL